MCIYSIYATNWADSGKSLIWGKIKGNLTFPVIDHTTVTSESRNNFFVYSHSHKANLRNSKQHTMIIFTSMLNVVSSNIWLNN